MTKAELRETLRAVWPDAVHISIGYMYRDHADDVTIYHANGTKTHCQNVNINES